VVAGTSPSRTRLPRRALGIHTLTDICLNWHTKAVSVSGTIHVIAEPNRLSILDELQHGEQMVSALVEKLEMSQPAVSKHLRVLRDAGLVSVRPDGQRRLYSVRPTPLIELDAWLEPYRRMWTESLDRLEAHLTESQTTPRRKQR
jgi:DNA-binding transcriptional ArsR family regulator